MSEKVLLVEEKDNLSILTLNRPGVMNAFNFELLHALKQEIDSIRFKSDSRVVIITGAGEKAFSAGADLKERRTLSDIQVKEYIFTIRNLFSSIERLNKPVIAAINGLALGGGNELVLACDIRIASSKASMGQPETRLAIIPGAGGTQRLPRLIGRGKAKELIFTGRRVGAEEAFQIGLVDKICEPEQLINESINMAALI
jgi:enoyl-CoA hydratase/carnithine racemase